MKYLEAVKIVKAFEGGEELSFLLGTSGETHPLEVFVKAAAAEAGREAAYRTLPFNTLAQTVLSDPVDGEREVFLLFPWDLLPEADWRSGVPQDSRPVEEMISSAGDAAARFERRAGARLLYVDAPIPSLFMNHRTASSLRDDLRSLAHAAGGEVLGEEVVSMSALFEHGLALSPKSLGHVARRVVAKALEESRDSAKVVITDFDHTLWHGVVGEVGVEGLAYAPTGAGFPHFVYQTYLRKLRRSGVLLAGVTKNDPDLARAPLETEESVLGPDDFVSIIASYNPKSAQIAELAEHLNLGLDSFVFVDDNPVEIAEVGRALPSVHLVPFPKDAAGLPQLIETLSALFHRETVTEEDTERTEMYRRRLAGMAPKDATGSDLTDFLRDLEMRLTIRDRSAGDRERAVQLINKTNQFNLNGIRRPDDEVGAILDAGGRLYTASLSDRHGDHGEILSFLIDADDVVRSYVMSCRVFQRRVEHAFIAWLQPRCAEQIRLEYVETERNEPIRRFLRDDAFMVDGDHQLCNVTSFVESSGDVLSLFDVRDEGSS